MSLGKSREAKSFIRPRTSASTWYTTTTSPGLATVKPSMELTIPMYGVFFMNPPEDARVHAQIRGGDPAYELPLNGTLTVTLPLDHSKMYYQSVKVGVVQISTLDLGLNRMGEADILFQRELSVSGDDPEINVIDRTLRFDFTIFLPCTLSCQAWEKSGRIDTLLYAILDGVPFDESEMLSSPDRSRAGRGAGKRGDSPSGSRWGSLTRGASNFMSMTRRGSQGPNSPTEYMSGSPSRGNSFTAMNRERSSTSVDRAPLSRTSSPTYTARPTHSPPAVDGKEVDWLRGSHMAEHKLRIVWNPDPAGGVNVLNEKNVGEIAGLGAYDIRVYSDIFTISTLVKASFAVVDIPPTTTIFAFQVVLIQTISIRSPRDLPSTKDTPIVQRIPIITSGTKPAANKIYPGNESPALWRGIKAGGRDEEVFILEDQGRIADDSTTRASTQPYQNTTIRISHVLEIDVFFSVYDTDAIGKPLFKPGPGELRVMQIRRAIMLPSCTLMPQNVDLPDYEHPQENKLGKTNNDPERPFDACACYLSVEEIEARMNAAARQEEIAKVERESALRRKAIAEQAARPHEQPYGSGTGGSLSSSFQ